MPTGGVLREEEAVQVDSSEFSSVPEDPLPPAGGVDPQGMGSPPAFPVFKAVPGSGQPDRPYFLVCCPRFIGQGSTIWTWVYSSHANY